MLTFIFYEEKKKQYEVKTDHFFLSLSPCVQKLGKIFCVAEAEMRQNRKWVFEGGV